MRALASSFSFLVACASAAPPVPPPPAPKPPPTLPPPSPPPLAQRFAATEPAYAFADPDRVTKLRSAFASIDAIGAAELAAQKVPSLAVAVVIDGDIAYAKGFGHADVAKKTPADGDTVYRIGSITKSFTGMAILALRDDGALTLDDPLTRHLPEAAGLVYPSRDAVPITLRQLLTHTSGLPRVGSFKHYEGTAEAEVLGSLTGFQLVNAPGSTFLYSNLGFGLLGLAAGRAAKTPYRDVVRKRFLGPLGMTSAAFDAKDVATAHAATPYKRGDDGTHATLTPWRLGATEASGGLWLSARDLGRWLAFQLSAYPPRGGEDPGPVKRATVREAHGTGVASGLWVRLEPTAKKGDKAVSVFATTYGFGWGTETTCDFDPIVSHNGAVDGFTSEVRFLPKHGVGVVVLVNAADGKPGPVATKMIEALQRTGALLPRKPVLSPAFGPAVAKLLALVTAWDDQAYAAMLTKDRPPFPTEKEEIAGYRERHGACRSWKPIDVADASSAKIAVECDKGKLDMSVRLGPDGLIAGFDGSTHDVTIPKDERAIADAVVKLLAKWDDRLYKKHFAAKFPDRAASIAFFEKVRAGHGSCSVKSASQAHAGKTILLSCERGGDLHLRFALDPKDRSVVLGYTIRPVPGGTCPLR